MAEIKIDQLTAADARRELRFVDAEIEHLNEQLQRTRKLLTDFQAQRARLTQRLIDLMERAGGDHDRD